MLRWWPRINPIETMWVTDAGEHLKPEDVKPYMQRYIVRYLLPADGIYGNALDSQELRSEAQSQSEG
jgi:hypothetical protein